MSTRSAASAASSRSLDESTQSRTPWLLGILCFLLPALPSDIVLPGPLKSNGSPARIIALAMFGLVCLGFLGYRRASRGHRVHPGVIILLVYFLLWLWTYGVGVLMIDTPYIAANKTRALIVLTAHVGVALFALTMVKTARQRKIVLGCLLAGLAFACLVALLQSVGSVDLRFLFQPPGFIFNAEDEALSVRLGAKRVTGTSQHPIEFSAVAAMTIPLAIYFARNAATTAARCFSTVVFILAALAMPAAVSRTGVISLAAAMLVYAFAFKARTVVTSILIGALLIGVYIAVFPHTANALWGTITGSADDPSILARTERYAGASRIFNEHKLFGLGLGGAPQLYDNQWLQTIVQGGLVGSAAMILLVVGTAFGVAAALRCASTQPEREQAYMLGAVATAILLSSTTFDLLFYQQASLIFFIAFGLLWSQFTVAVPERRPQRPDRLL